MGNPAHSTRVNLPARIKLYRCLQILEKQFNLTLSTRVIPATMVVSPWLQIYCTFVMIKLARYLPSSGFMTYPFTIFICVMVCVVFETFAAQIFVNSEQQRAEWWLDPELTKLNRSRIRSRRPMRIQVGSNFIDRGTALVTQNFCITQTVSLLLM
ncbi:hypothetical protein Fcan01_24347 [Folsomia candida]|uniref:Uncharacterized protein n=1 Tax=Folsomia candida TaxID=158441 RepID=A0A226D8V6_FOLCA|nr:hypothetical protein Fcan01_24347 [Folsomia candida]